MTGSDDYTLRLYGGTLGRGLLLRRGPRLDPDARDPSLLHETNVLPLTRPSVVISPYTGKSQGSRTEDPWTTLT